MLRLAVAAKPRIQAGIKLAHLLEMSERDFEERLRELEADDVFRRLLKIGVISHKSYPSAPVSMRRFEGWEMRGSEDGLSELLDGNGEIVRLMRRAGEAKFREFFLGEGPFSDEEAARGCGISVQGARKLKELVDRVYIQAEWNSPSDRASPVKTFSAVARIDLEGGRPALSFFRQAIWKHRYQIDEEKRRELLTSLPPRESRRIRSILSQVELLEHRKTTLYRVLEAVVELQGAFLATGKRQDLRPLTQVSLAAQLDISPSVLNRLISNKTVQLPWGLEVPLKTLLPSRKTVLRDRLCDLATKHTHYSDEKLRQKLWRSYGAALSRQSITQYRKELGLNSRST
ncbi:MAG: hypothetical protein HY402_06140 [Elusimicrobia bacterium]|nr:hypothetical protein [Elusimicrobiota bacterium]